MWLTGTFRRSLDEKLRVALPKSLREAIGCPENSVLYLAPGTDGSLDLYPERSFSRLAEKLEHGSANVKEVRAFSRLFYAQVQRVELDAHGRVRLPAELAGLASLRKEIVLLGVRDHLEVWDSECWEAYAKRTQPHYDDLAEQALSSRPTPDPSTARSENQ
jgi:MraZ protein